MYTHITHACHLCYTKAQNTLAQCLEFRIIDSKIHLYFCDGDGDKWFRAVNVYNYVYMVKTAITYTLLKYILNETFLLFLFFFRHTGYVQQ